MKSWFTNKDRLLAGTIIAGASVFGFAGPAMAQSQSDEIVVTGSRIPQPNLVTTSPVTQVTAEDVTTQGVTRIEDLINQLPQAFAAQNSTVANGSDGTASVDLRGLGSARTLVLVDGRRMPYGSPTNSAADLNQIPAQLVERVEVLTGGASAVYGSDAVAGVVNFIMKDDFEGVQFDAQYSFFQHNNDYDGPGNLREVIAARAATNPSQFALPEDNVADGYGKEFSVLIGASTEDGRGNVTAYAGYRTNDAILQRDRDYSACSLGNTAPNLAALEGPNGVFTCGGSGTSFPGTFTDFLTFNLTVDSAGDGNLFRPFNATLDQYNFGPINYFQRPDERYNLGAFARYEVNRHFEVYAQLMFTDSSTVAQIAPSGNFFNTSTINCDNPLLSNDGDPLTFTDQYSAICEGDRVIDIEDDVETAWDEVDDFINGIGRTAAGVAIPPEEPLTAQQIADNTAIVAASLGEDTCTNNSLDFEGNPFFDPDTCPLYIGRRNVEGGGRQDTLRYESYRAVLGARGNIVDGWDYDVSAMFSRNQMSRAYLNEFSVSRLRRAIDVIDVGGVPTCRSVVDGSDANCVPYDIFTLGNLTQEALDYLQTPGIHIATMENQVVTAAVTGDLGTIGLQSPAAETPFQTAFGVEYRRDSLESLTDTQFASGDLAGQGGATIGLSGETDVVDIFAELRAPLVENAPFADLLALDLAYRYSDYSTGVTTDTYKIGGEWAPVEDIRFRASYQKAVRAANIVELFTAQGFNLFDMDGDPCGEDGTATLADCVATGVPAANYGSPGLNSPAGQYNFLQGGNPNLDPEEAETKTIGIVFTPSFIPGLSVSVDWFEIVIEDTVSTFGAENTLNACYDNGDAAACARIVRNPNGSLWVGTGNVQDLNINIGSLETTGVDLNVNYGMDIGSMGGLNFNLTGTWLDELITAPGPGIDPFDCAGFFGSVCLTPSPEWRHRFRVGWDTPFHDLSLAATWRYYGEVELFNGSEGRIDYAFDSYSYFDLAGNFPLFENTNIRFGVNNVLDEDPPLSASVGTTGNGNTYPQTYDSMGRYFFAGVTLDF